MKTLGRALGLVSLAIAVSTAFSQTTKPATPAETITGTITESNSIIEAVFGDSSEPAKWHGITFQLQEFPGRQFVFNSASFNHEGRQLMGNLKGTKVQLTCKSPGQKTCRVATLKWLSPAPPARKKS